MKSYIKYKLSKHSNSETEDTQIRSKKDDPTICYLQNTHFEYKDTD